MEALINENLGILTTQDILDVFNVIHTANAQLRLSEMRARVVRSLKQAFNASGVVFLLGDREFRVIDNANIVGEGIDFNYLDRWVGYYRHHDPFQHEKHSKIPVCKVDDVLPFRRWLKSKIYNEFYRPQNIHYKLSISLRSDAKVLGLIGLFRSREYVDFSVREMTKGRILAPYLTTALENISQFTEVDQARNLFGGCIDHLPVYGVMVLDYELRPLYLNTAAMDFCTTLTASPRPGDMSQTCAGHPSLPSEILQDCLTLKECFEKGNQTLLRRQRCLEGQGNKKYQAITSLVEDLIEDVTCRRFVVYLLDSSELSKGKEEVLRDRYQLTRREIEIVQWVSKGFTNDQIGERLFISRFTVETHLKNIFDKAGVRHRTELANLLQSI